MGKVLVISVHPDDETLGCGGTLLKHYNKGDQLYWLILTSPVKYRGYSDAFISNREAQICDVSMQYHFEKVIQAGFEASGLYKVDESKFITYVSDVITDLKPQTIYTVNRSDIHSDHRIAFKIIMSCTKTFRHPYIKKILMYECLSETEMAPPLIENVFVPNVYVDITEFFEKKIEIMSIYKSEIQPQPMPRSIENIKALAIFRGSTVGVKYSEAFMLLREIV